MSQSNSEFDIDDFLASKSAARLQEMIAEAVERGAKRAYWTVTFTWVVIGLVVWIIAASQQ